MLGCVLLHSAELLAHGGTQQQALWHSVSFSSIQCRHWTSGNVRRRTAARELDGLGSAPAGVDISTLSLALDVLGASALGSALDGVGGSVLGSALDCSTIGPLLSGMGGSKSDERSTVRCSTQRPIAQRLARRPTQLSARLCT